jgi:hypothetical protein
MSSFVKLNRTSETLELMRCPYCFTLLCLIALRAKRTNSFSEHGLEIGEALVGDYEKIGLTRQQYRTCIDKLKKWQFITTKTTTKGTIAKLMVSTVLDVNVESDQPTKQPESNHQATTNKNVKERKEEIPPIYSFI